MVRCYDCGQSIPDHLIIRSTAHTGTSWAWRRGLRFYFHKVNLCPKCEASRSRKFAIVAIVAIVGVLLLCGFGSLFHPDQSATAEKTPADVAPQQQNAARQPPARVPDPKLEPPRQLTPEELVRHRARMAKLKEQIAKEAEEKAKQDAAQQEKAAAAALQMIKQNMSDGKGNTKQRLQRLVERFPGTEAAKEAEKLLKDPGQ